MLRYKILNTVARLLEIIEEGNKPCKGLADYKEYVYRKHWAAIAEKQVSKLEQEYLTVPIAEQMDI